MANDLRNLSQQFGQRIMQLEEEKNRLIAERDHLNHVLQAKNHIIQNTATERDRAFADRIQAYRDRDLVRQQMNNLHHRQRQTESRLADIEQKYEKTIKDLRKTIQLREEQLAGKRSLWLDNHPSSNVRHAASSSSGDYERYTTPTLVRTSNSGHFPPNPAFGPINLTKKFQALRPASERVDNSFSSYSAQTLTPGPSISVPARTAMPSDTLSLLPSGHAKPTQQLWSTTGFIGSGPGSRANFGSVTSPPDGDAQAVVPFKSLATIAGEFKELFDSNFGKIEKYAFKYGKRVPEISVDQKLSHDQAYWASLMRCAFPKDVSIQQAHSHTILLLRDAQTRPWFVMRIFVQYLIDEVFSARNWLNFNKEYNDELEKIQARLTEKGLSVDERGRLVTSRTNIITAITKSNKYAAYRSYSLSHHTSNVRARLGPLLDLEAKRADAGRDIGTIIVQAYDLSVKIFSSYKTFISVFPDCGGKFLDTSMTCRDDNVLYCDTLDLQIKQFRLKLVMTPIITIRDDRMATIEVKEVHHAHILTMK